MKKETKLSKTCEKFIEVGVKALIIENDNKIPKGFVKASYYDEGREVTHNLVLPKSIYDKRMMLITKYVLEHEHCYWSVKDTNHIQKIIDGGYDGV